MIKCFLTHTKSMVSKKINVVLKSFWNTITCMTQEHFQLIIKIQVPKCVPWWTCKIIAWIQILLTIRANIIMVWLWKLQEISRGVKKLPLATVKGTIPISSKTMASTWRITMTQMSSFALPKTIHMQLTKYQCYCRN